MSLLKSIIAGIAFTLLGATGAFSQCSGQFQPGKVCGNATGTLGLPGPISVTPSIFQPIAGGAVIGNSSPTSAVPSATSSPVLGVPGASTGQVGFSGSTSGTAILRAQTTAGSAISFLPTVGGTLVGSASAPLSIGSATGSVSLAFNSTLNLSAGNLGLNLASPNSWTAKQTFLSGSDITGLRLNIFNVGGFSRTQLNSLFNLDGTGASAFGWNYSGGGGELSLFINKDGGGAGGLGIYDFPNGSGDPKSIFTLRGNDGTAIIGAPNSFSPADGFGGQLQVYSKVAGGVGNSIVGSALQNSAPTSPNFPTGVTGYCKQEPTSSGNTCFGMFARSDQYATGSSTNEFNSFNFYGPPSPNLPPDQSFGTTQTQPITLQLAAGGTYPSSMALQITPEGAQPQTYLTGIYSKPEAITDNGIIIDAATNVGFRGPTNSAILKNYGSGTNLTLTTTGPFVAGNAVVKFLDAGGVSRFNINQAGQINSLSGANFGDDVTLTKSVNGIVTNAVSNTNVGGSSQAKFAAIGTSGSVSFAAANGFGAFSSTINGTFYLDSIGGTAGFNFRTGSGPTSALILGSDQKATFGSTVTATGYIAGVSTGLSTTKTVRASGGASDCTLIYTGGILTGGTC